ncbi:lipopolysaccharide-induced tumor necrosis factor-alpha factor homolog [Erpetoichthys calabaricus]|uniref:Lipopolysaccharide-induced TNF factor n=1 Tax=Erpetoichthys calabaricus TaxID=27687 RepID=A0A8C4SEZ2_ERPCA|nr:lipopolysaccharide-induced tumor necrosis factor-alpha factor homolog [Erpetoichthys calabaricus]
MASAPPLEYSPNVMGPQPPSYQETMGLPYPPSPAYPQQPPPDGNFGKGPVPMYPAQVPAAPSVTNQTVQTVYVQHHMNFLDRPVQTLCPVCQQMITTQLEYSSGVLTWLSCGGLFIFGCPCGCCLIPFCVDSLKDVTHWCPNCKSILGVHKRL